MFMSLFLVYKNQQSQGDAVTGKKKIRNLKGESGFQ